MCRMQGQMSKEQISQIEYFISKQMDVIVVIARDCGALSQMPSRRRRVREFR